MSNYKKLKNAKTLVLICSILKLVLLPAITKAQLGVQQPEVSTFLPANATDMVQLQTGNFNYNIPPVRRSVWQQIK